MLTRIVFAARGHRLHRAVVAGLAMFALSGPAWAQHAAKTTTTPTAKSGAQSTANDRFTTEAAAKAHCPAGTVVWANTTTKVFHFAGTPGFGHSKRGAYMCEQEATAAHFRAAKNEKHP